MIFRLIALLFYGREAVEDFEKSRPRKTRRRKTRRRR